MKNSKICPPFWLAAGLVAATLLVPFAAGAADGPLHADVRRIVEGMHRLAQDRRWPTESPTGIYEYRTSREDEGLAVRGTPPEDSPFTSQYMMASFPVTGPARPQMRLRPADAQSRSGRHTWMEVRFSPDKVVFDIGFNNGRSDSPFTQNDVERAGGGHVAYLKQTIWALLLPGGNSNRWSTSVYEAPSGNEVSQRETQEDGAVKSLDGPRAVKLDRFMDQWLSEMHIDGSRMTDVDHEVWKDIARILGSDDSPFFDLPRLDN